MKQPNIIIHADDLGLSKGFNLGIRKAASEGSLTSTCIRVNGTAYKEAVEEFVPDFPNIGLGLHLNIVEGQTLRTDAGVSSLLCDESGRFKNGFGGLFRLRRNRAFLDELEQEYRNQIEVALKDLGSLDHLNSHQHSHAIPEIFELTCHLAEEYGVPYVRLPRETWYWAGPFSRHLHPLYLPNIAKWLILNTFSRRNKRIADRYKVQTNDAFVGIIYTGFMNGTSLIEGLRPYIGENKTIEVLLHPAIPTGAQDEYFLDPGIRDYVINDRRNTELEALLDRDANQSVCLAGQLTNYRSLAEKKEWAPTQVKEPSKHEERIRGYLVLDETPFYHPDMLQQLLRRCPQLEVAGVAIVKLPGGGVLQSYLSRNIFRMKFREIVFLTLKKYGLILFGQLPGFLRGNFESSIEGVCKKFRLDYDVVSQVNSPEFLSKLKTKNPDVIISSNSLIFGEELMSIPRLGCINRHSSLLPSNGGILPAFRAIQNNDSHIGVSVHMMEKAIDKGPILSRKWVPIFPGDSLGDLYKYCFILSVPAIIDALDALLSGSVPSGLSDEGIQASYYSFPDGEDWQAFRANGGKFI
jgi:predicted glycoside hydrolase/deacetylase ChbG (UPF0249 family)